MKILFIIVFFIDSKNINVILLVENEKGVIK